MLPPQKIAPGHDNTAGLSLLAYKFFPKFRPWLLGAVSTEWYDSETRRNDSTDYPKEIGRPYCVWIFPVLTREEYQLLKDTYGRYVTISTFDKGENEYKTFNAELVYPRLLPENWRAGRWINVRLTFQNLEEIV